MSAVATWALRASTSGRNPARSTLHAHMQLRQSKTRGHSSKIHNLTSRHGNPSPQI